jgi:glycerol-3-phosphate dehydrogenase (NAD(P)+)
MLTTFTVLGDGSWGTAIALLLARNSAHRVRLWSARSENGQILQKHRENVKFLPGVSIPQTIQLTCDIREAVADADFWISAIPTKYLRSTLSRIQDELASGVRIPPVVSLTKGMEMHTLRRPSEIITELLGVEEVIVLSGPSHAEEVCRSLPCSVVVAGGNPALAAQVQTHFSTERFRVYTNLDPVGVELAGALKNVIGIAAGACDGLGYGDNAISALITRGLVEMTRFGVALGAEASTFAGLAGLGDLITTCFSKHGRNRSVGQRLATGEKLREILATSIMVAEGVTTAQAVHDRAAGMRLDMPITTEVYRVLYEDKNPRDAVNDLMLRSPKGERWPS